MNTPDLEVFYARYADDVMGIDEVGRGPLPEPVVAAAVLLDSRYPIEGLRDSKVLSEKARDALFPVICAQARVVRVTCVPPSRLDAINILRASLEAMAFSFIRARRRVDVKAIFVDGNQKIPNLPDILQFTCIKGDTKWPPIMAASIVAKVVRDRLMRKLAKRFPGYGLEQHKGYGTRAHLEALNRLGPTLLHRVSFAPVREAWSKCTLGEKPDPSLRRLC